MGDAIEARKGEARKSEFKRRKLSDPEADAAIIARMPRAQEAASSIVAAKSEPKPEREPEAEPAEAVDDIEAEYIEDDTDAASDAVRRMWRLQTALAFLDPAQWSDRVGAMLWWMSERNRDAGCNI